jgi:hypothetical protein
MPHPWVYSATITDGKISFHVEVSDLHTTVGAIEISGIATQVNGAFAPIYHITDIPSEPNGDASDADQAGRYFVDVAADPTPDHPFAADEDVTIFVRVSKVWVTVLGPGSDDLSPHVPGSPMWAQHLADSHVIAPGGAVSSTLTSS